MAQFVHPVGNNTFTYRGLDEFFEYTNWDGAFTKTNCGQAAAATFLTHHGRWQADPSLAKSVMARLEEHYPPNNLFGKLGTSRKQVERICRQNSVPLQEIRGETEFRAALRQGRPVIVMLGVTAFRILNLVDLPGGHWMVAYGFDDEYVYLSNWGKKPWDEFRRGWRSLVARLISMNDCGLIAQNGQFGSCQV